MRSSAACLTLLFILSLSVVSMTSLQPVRAETRVRYYLQSDDARTVSARLGLHPWGIEYWNGLWNMTVLYMDTLTPDGRQAACSWCDFATRPLVNSHTFKSFKLHLYVRWPECLSSSCRTCAQNDTRISLAIGFAAADFSRINYGYEEPLRAIGKWAVLDFVLSGFNLDIQQEVTASVGAGNRLVFHFGIRPVTLGYVQSLTAFMRPGYYSVGGFNPTIEDAPCGVVRWEVPAKSLVAHPTILFGDSEHASYIETDEVELQGLPVPEFSSFLIMLPVILALTILLRREKNRRLGRSPK